MKIRSSFVSNSSSSSFICDITGEEVQGMDLSLSEAEMFMCENDHTFLDEYIVGNFDESEWDDGRYEIPSKYCPICTFEYIIEDSMIMYMTREYGVTYEDVFKYMKEKNSRLRKVRNMYWFELLERDKGISKLKLQSEIKSKYSSLNKFDQDLKKK